jgi:hypothetical protein
LREKVAKVFWAERQKKGELTPYVCTLEKRERKRERERERDRERERERETARFRRRKVISLVQSSPSFLGAEKIRVLTVRSLTMELFEIIQSEVESLSRFQDRKSRFKKGLSIFN